MTADEALAALVRNALEVAVAVAAFYAAYLWLKTKYLDWQARRDYVAADEDNEERDEKHGGNGVPEARERSEAVGNGEHTPHNDGVLWPERLTRDALVQMLAASGLYSPAEITAALLRPQVQADGFITDPTPENLLRWLAANTDFGADAIARMISMRRELALDIIRSVRQPEVDEIKIDNGTRTIPRHVGRIRRAATTPRSES